MRAAKGKTHVTLTLPVELHDQLLDQARTVDRTLSGLIRLILMEYMRDVNSKGEKDKSLHDAAQ